MLISKRQYNWNNVFVTKLAGLSGGLIRGRTYNWDFMVS